MNKVALFIIINSLMVSCQTIDIVEKKTTCASLDWFEIGRSAGVQGLDSLGWQKSQEECSDFTKPNHESYVNGWYAGINEFCSESHGFAYGKSGYEYNSVCPTSKEAEFLEAYNKGTKIYLYETDSQSITNELQKLSDRKFDLDSEQQAVLLKRVNELETRLEFNQALITEINREMEESSSQSSTL